jgi:hypothetical protein
MSHAATSLLPWLTDPDRFSADWIAAVRQAEAWARAALRP